MFRTRQAPSPTGYLHLGTARQMLFSKLLAQHFSGVWFLRVEDTDRNRLVPDAVTNMLEALEAIGLAPDEGVTLEEKGKPDDFYGVYQKGSVGPYIQSERLKLYHKHVDGLINKKLAYWCYLSDEEREELRDIKQATKRPINYYQANIEKGNEDKMFLSFAQRQEQVVKPVLRYRIQRNESLECNDELLGTTSFDLSLEEDLILLKSDDYPTYHLAHIVDDHLMQTSMVVRAQEWYSSLPKHVLMFKEYWGEKHIPQYMHLPVILGKTGNKKLSKRDGGVSIKEDYLEKGYLPEALINYLAFLGWNPGSQKELYLEAEDFTSLSQKERLTKLIDNITVDFNVDKITKTSARFDPDKLDWFNKEYLKMMSLHEYISLRFGHDMGNAEAAPYILDKNRAVTTHDEPGEVDVIVNWQAPADEDVIFKKQTPAETAQILHELKTCLDITPSYSSDDSFEMKVDFWQQHIKGWLQHNNQEKFGPWLSPLRIALSGKKQSPSPFEILSLIHKEEAYKRLDTVISSLQSSE